MREQSSAPKEQWTPETEPGPGQPVNGAITPKAPSRMDNLAPDPLPPTTFSPQVAMALDRLFCAHIGNFTGGLDPRVIPLAYLDWWVKLAWSPGTHARLAEKAIRKAVRLGIYMNQTLMDPQSPPAIYPLPPRTAVSAPPDGIAGHTTYFISRFCLPNSGGQMPPWEFPPCRPVIRI